MGSMAEGKRLVSQRTSNCDYEQCFEATPSEAQGKPETAKVGCR